MRFVHPTLILGASLLVACGTDPSAGDPAGPTGLALSGSPVVESASGGYHFTTDPRFFGFPVDNRLTFTAKLRHAGRFDQRALQLRASRLRGAIHLQGLGDMLRDL